MMLEATQDSTKIIAHPCSYDGFSSRLVEEAGFPIVFLAGYAVASSYGLPDTGYIAMQEMCDKIQETVRQVNVPVMADGDTGYGSPMNVKRTVQSFALAGAAGVMIEDQTWPKSKRTRLWSKSCNTIMVLMLMFRMWAYQGQGSCLEGRSICPYSGCGRRP
jgi:2-methylisocitrate lyase-like PEP mutase family enzyme